MVTKPSPSPRKSAKKQEIVGLKIGASQLAAAKVMNNGGMLNTRSMIATAQAAGIRCVVGHGFGLGVNTMAEIMVAATSANVIPGLECVGPMKMAADIVRSRIDLGCGTLALPMEAVVLGLGIIERGVSAYSPLGPTTGALLMILVGGTVLALRARPRAIGGVAA